MFEVPKEIKRPLFKEFIKFLYFDDIQIPNLTIDEILYLCELCDFYGLANSRLKHLVESQLKDQIDKFNVMSLLDISDKVNAMKIKQMCLRFLAENFELFAGPELAGYGTG